MPFEQEVIEYVDGYVNNHLADMDWHRTFFSFIKDQSLASRLAVEFRNARYIYKLFEGIQATDELLLAQVRIQIILYSSIYEAAIHFILFEYYANTRVVKDLVETPQAVQIFIPNDQKEKLRRLLVHCGEEVVPYVIRRKRRDIPKIRFDEKCCACHLLGLLDEDLRDELIKLYNLRNAVHIQAELRKALSYELDMSKTAYLRLERFKQSVENKMKEDKII